MKALKRIALTELQVMFYSPIAWFILIIFLKIILHIGISHSPTEMNQEIFL